MHRLVLLAALLPCLSLACYRPPATTGPAAQVTPAARVYTREEFKALVLGKTEAEVIEAVGRPDRTDGAGMWVYRNRTRDLVTGKTDGTIRVFFREGKVSSVMF